MHWWLFPGLLLMFCSWYFVDPDGSRTRFMWWARRRFDKRSRRLKAIHDAEQEAQMEVRLSQKAFDLFHTLRLRPYWIVGGLGDSAPFTELCEKGLVIKSGGYYILSEAGKNRVTAVLDESERG